MPDSPLKSLCMKQELINDIWWKSRQKDECGTRPSLRWVQMQDHGPNMLGGSKNASGPIGIPLKGLPQVPGDKPKPSEEG